MYSVSKSFKKVTFHSFFFCHLKDYIILSLVRKLFDLLAFTEPVNIILYKIAIECSFFCTRFFIITRFDVRATRGNCLTFNWHTLIDYLFCF